MKGTLYGIGVGPGDPKLLTLKAVDIIKTSDVIAAPDSGSGETMALDIIREFLSGQEVCLCPAPMTRDRRILDESRAEVADKLCALLDKGKTVAFLTLGDPSVYATYSYLHRLVAERGHHAEIIPGVTSFCAAAAALGVPLCEDEQPLHILPASFEGLGEALGLPGTKVIMKLGKQMDGIMSMLRDKGQLKHTKMVQRCSLPDEAVLKDVGEAPGSSGYFTLLVIKEAD